MNIVVGVWFSVLGSRYSVLSLGLASFLVNVCSALVCSAPLLPAACLAYFWMAAPFAAN